MDDDQLHRFIGSGVEAPQFEALSRQGSSAYQGLEVFPNPGCEFVVYSSDEVVACCPITGQPDYYVCEIALKNSPKLIESKSLKLYFNNLHESTMTRKANGIFCETLAVFLRGEIADVTECDEENVRVTLTQKPRGGISIKAVA